MKEILTNPVFVQLELSVINNILKIINKATHGHSHEFVESVKNKIMSAKHNSENEQN